MNTSEGQALSGRRELSIIAEVFASFSSLDAVMYLVPGYFFRLSDSWEENAGPPAILVSITSATER